MNRKSFESFRKLIAHWRSMETMYYTEAGKLPEDHSAERTAHKARASIYSQLADELECLCTAQPVIGDAS